MNREQTLHRRMHTLKTLSEAVSAMRSLSAHQFRLSRQALPAARMYRHEMEEAVAQIGVGHQLDIAAPPGLLLVASDLGLCGDYNSRLVQTALDERDGPLFCVGRRPRTALTRHSIQPDRSYDAPTSVDGLPRLLLQLAQDMLDDFIRRTIGSLFVVSAQFQGAGSFAPTVTCVLPIPNTATRQRYRPTPYQTRRRLVAVAAREFLYTTLYELLLDSLASEHGMRLIAAESARQWLDETTTNVGRQLSACRREAATQEVLDIVAGTKRRKS